jgi:hypothetical protein
MDGKETTLSLASLEESLRSMKNSSELLRKTGPNDPLR